MGLKMKFRQKFKFTATAFLMMFGAHAQSQAQKSAQAVMTVSVRVVSAPEFVNNIVADITDQVQQQNEVLSLGAYSMKFPSGTGYTISVDSVISMKGKTGAWNIDTSVAQQTDPQGNLTLNYSGTSKASSSLSGNYVGQLNTQIEYH